MQAQNTDESDPGLVLGASSTKQASLSYSYEIYASARLLDEINAVRLAHGLTDLKGDTTMTTVSQRHSDELSRLPYAHVRENYLANTIPSPIITHTGTTFGTSHRERLETYGITAVTSGENIIAQPLVNSMIMEGDHIVSVDTLPLDVVINDSVQAWMASPEHRANILLPEYTHTGIGAVVRDRHLIITQLFARQP